MQRKKLSSYLMIAGDLEPLGVALNTSPSTTASRTLLLSIPPRIQTRVVLTLSWSQSTRDSWCSVVADVQLHPSVVALHGLTGHAWNTFTTSELADKHTHQTREHNWLQDSLPRLLEQHYQQKIYSRVMSFGYNADVWMTKSIADLDVPVRNLIHYLDIERREV